LISSVQPDALFTVLYCEKKPRGIQRVDFVVIIYFDLLYLQKQPHIHHYHHQPINVPTAGAQAFLMDYPQGERAITHHAGPVRIGGC
jgi:hypothetical protein